MKEAYLHCMSLLFPDGLPNAEEQHRDTIKIFSMGWAEALKKNNDKEGLTEWVVLCQPISKPNWWPDDSWKWWDLPSRN